MSRRQRPKRNEPHVAATCTSCGDIRVPAATMAVTVDKPTYENSYVFTCPQCGTAAMRETNLSVACLLVAAGALEIVLSAELSEPHAGPVITHDDVLDFHFALIGDGWRKELEATA